MFKPKKDNKISNEEISNLNNSIEEYTSQKLIHKDDITYILSNGEKVNIRPVQPIVFHATKDSYLSFPKLTYSDPLRAMAEINAEILNDKEFQQNVSDLPNEKLVALALNENNNANIFASNYIKANTFSNFCAMIDSLGPEISTVLQYAPIKEKVYNKLYLDTYGNYSKVIDDIIMSAQDQILNRYITVTREESMIMSECIAKQLDQILYACICYGIDDAINETYLNANNYTNTEIMNNVVMETLGLTDDDVIKLHGSIKLKGFALSNMIKNLIIDPLNLLMSSIIDPSVHECIYALSMSRCFQYNEMLAIKNIESRNQCKK
jgi:hypothetical protein